MASRRNTSDSPASSEDRLTSSATPSASNSATPNVSELLYNPGFSRSYRFWNPFAATPSRSRSHPQSTLQNSASRASSRDTRWTEAVWRLSESVRNNSKDAMSIMRELRVMLAGMEASTSATQPSSKSLTVESLGTALTSQDLDNPMVPKSEYGDSNLRTPSSLSDLRFSPSTSDEDSPWEDQEASGGGVDFIGIGYKDILGPGVDDVVSVNERLLPPRPGERGRTMERTERPAGFRRVEAPSAMPMASDPKAVLQWGDHLIRRRSVGRSPVRRPMGASGHGMHAVVVPHDPSTPTPSEPRRIERESWFELGKTRH